jgi:hypothetical protein
VAEAVTGYTELFGDFCAGEDGSFPRLGAHAARVCALPGALALRQLAARAAPALPDAHARVCVAVVLRRRLDARPLTSDATKRAPSSLNCICLAGVAAYLASPQRFPFPDGAVADAYVKNVGDVLN